jgi:hypothetical protein
MDCEKMPNRIVGPILAAALLGCSVGLLAQNPVGTRSRGANATPDLSGVWSLGDQGILTSASQFAAAEAAARDIAAGRVPSFAFSTELPPMQPWAAEKYKAARAGRAPHEAGNDELDPINYPYCLPYTFPRIMTAPFAFEIVATPEQIFMHFESDHMTRRIYLDGRKHLEGWGPTYLGTSHGKWDGDTLVVETDNILSLNRHAWLDGFGLPFTDALRVTERIRRPAQDTLQFDFVFNDPGTYTRPWTGRKLFQIKLDWDITEARICESHMREDFLRDMDGGKPAGRP